MKSARKRHPQASDGDPQDLGAKRRVPIRTGAVLLIFALLSGCGSLLESDAPPRAQWWLEPVSLPSLALATDAPLTVRLSVVPGLDTDRILNLDGNARLNSYAGAYWPDHLPEVLTSVVLRSLAEAHEAPVEPGDRADDSGCLLSIETRAFFGRVDLSDRTQAVEVDFSGTVTCGEVRRSIEGKSTTPVNENRMATIVAAFQSSLSEALQALVTDTGSG